MRAALSTLTLIATLIALTACSSEADRLYRRASDAEDIGDYEQAIAYVDDAIALEPGEGRFHRARGDWHRDLAAIEDDPELYHEALAAYDAAISAESPSGSAHMKAIEVCFTLLEMGEDRAEEIESRIAAARDALSDSEDLAELATADERLTGLLSGEESAPDGDDAPDA